MRTQREPHHLTTTSLTTTPLHHLTPLPSHHLTHPFPSHLTGKDVASHKTTGIADALRLAFPNHSEVILDGEAVLRDKDGLVLPFGEQGVHKQKAHNDVTCCLLAFDLIGEQQIAEQHKSAHSPSRLLSPLHPLPLPSFDST